MTLFERFETVSDIADWRDAYADRPRTADYAIQTVSRLFNWAKRRGLAKTNPAETIERLHRSNRADLIWLDEHMETFCKHASEELQWAVKLAVATGLRQGDLLTLRWSDVKEEAITLTTKKRSRLAVVPLIPEAKAVLAQIKKRGPFVLTNSQGRPWTSDGFRASFNKARKRAKIEGLHFHDCRGSAATRFALAGFTDEQIALVFGWSVSSVRDLKARYVSADAIALDMLSGTDEIRGLTNRRQTGGS